MMSLSAYDGSNSPHQHTAGSGAGARIVINHAPPPGLGPAADPFLFPTVRLRSAIEIGPESKTR
ncbi:hypothetical protein K6W26_21665 [Burkholderia sp. AU42008]|uniref:hypothetical protein n=1 Tax=unclassified Burkholderia TaxID=2613784 RepID=UPI0011786C7F|nr:MULTISPECIES: hypothetical protein [unclassified Burkholderia]MBR8238597.1 hypothetical protein [Burkholderia sp. AU32357]MBY4875666.1 hypothetical protein [Burkholderia sp. AU42008]